MPKRDADLVVIVVLFVLSGVFSLVSPLLVNLASSRLNLNTSFTPFSIISLVLSGLLSLVTAFGLWNFQKWGWFLGVGILLIGIGRSLINGSFLAIIIPALMLIYLFQKRQKFLQKSKI